MKLNKCYSIDECTDEGSLLHKLDQLTDENKITYTIEDKWLLKLVDVDLTEVEELQLMKLFDSIEVVPFTDNDEDEEDYDDFTDNQDYDDMGFSTKKRGGKYDDDF